MPKKGGKGMPISGSPFEVPVSAGAITAAKCTAKGPGLSAARCGDAARFVVSIRTASDEPVALPSDNQALLVTLVDRGESAHIDGVIGSQVVQGAYVNKELGEYAVEYVAECAGTAELSVEVMGASIQLSPFQVAVSPGAADAGQSVAFGDAVQVGCLGVEAVFTIQAKDKFGNQLVTGGDKFEVQLGKNPCKVSLYFTQIASRDD
jgi:hypothetical protein